VAQQAIADTTISAAQLAQTDAASASVKTTDAMMEFRRIQVP